MSLPLPHNDPAPRIAELARRFRRANGPVISLMNRFGGQVERQLDALPDRIRHQIEAAVARALNMAHGIAGAAPAGPRLGRRLGRGAAPIAAAVTGAFGGMGGIVTAIPELPVTVTLILHAIRGAAAAEGFDPDDPAIRAECLGIFAAGSPLGRDDGVNTGFVGARLAMSGSAVQGIIAAVAPRLAAALGQKLAAQAVPVIGALAGAALNAAYLSYYRELAQIRFALLRLAQEHGAAATLAAFRAAVEPAPAVRL
jgi:EcsC protein family